MICILLYLVTDVKITWLGVFHRQLLLAEQITVFYWLKTKHTFLYTTQNQDIIALRIRMHSEIQKSFESTENGNEISDWFVIPCVIT